MGAFILENDRWILLAAILSFLELKEAYRIFKYDMNDENCRVNKVLICSYSLCAVALPIIIVCHGTILTFSLIYFLNQGFRCLVKQSLNKTE